MVILHAFLALASGIATTMILIAGFDLLLARVAPSWAESENRPRLGSVVVNFGWSFLAAAAGGYVTAVMAGANPLQQVLALAIVVLALAAMSALQARGKQPVWYLLALIAISPAGVVAGGLLRLRVLGIL